MAAPRSLMEKSVRSAIQRHLRGWPPYPHVQIVATPDGHNLRWGDEKDILNLSSCVWIETIGMPSRRNFSIAAVRGDRKWVREDMHMMDNNPAMTSAPWAVCVPQGQMENMAEDDCVSMLGHLRKCWAQNPRASALFDCIDAQNFAPLNRLHVVLDTMAAASTPEALYEEKENIAPLARIVLGHAMQSERGAWACKFAHPTGKWANMALCAWKSSNSWNLVIAPRNNPILFSDYHWENMREGLVFYDRLPANAPVETLTGRGCYERYARSHHMDDKLGPLHWDALDLLVSSSISSIEPDTVWTRPLQEGLRQGLVRNTSIAPEYFAFIRAFEEKAFDFLCNGAVSPKGQALHACMMVSRSLDEPGKSVKDLQQRMAGWGTAMERTECNDVIIDGNLFAGLCA